MSRLNMITQPVLAVINDVFDLPHRKIKFFSEALISDPVQ